MRNYRRAFVPGGSWFFTVNLERHRTLLVDHITHLRDAVARTRQDRPFTIEAIIMLHAVWTLPPDDADFPTRWRLIRSRFRFARVRRCVRRSRWQRTKR